MLPAGNITSEKVVVKENPDTKLTVNIKNNREEKISLNDFLEVFNVIIKLILAKKTRKVNIFFAPWKVFLLAAFCCQSGFKREERDVLILVIKSRGPPSSIDFCCVVLRGWVGMLRNKKSTYIFT